MDPNETLATLRRLGLKLIELNARYSAGDITREYWTTEQAEIATHQAQAFFDLDERLIKKGVLPTDWQR